MTDLERCLAFVQRADMVGTRTQGFAYGTAVFLPELPLRHDSNYLLVDRLPEDDPVDALIAAAEELQGGAGLEHRCLMFRDADLGERVADAFEERGWSAFRGTVMAHRRPSQKDVDTSRVVRSSDDVLREVRTRNVLRYPWSTPEVARQLLASRAFSPVPTDIYAVFDGGAPVAWAELYVEDGIGQVESVATEPDHRNRGHASAIVLRCVEEARLRGADLVFLCAAAADWPARLYERLGFDEIGRYLKLTRVPATRPSPGRRVSLTSDRRRAMSGWKTVAAAVVLGFVAGFAGGRLGAPDGAARPSGDGRLEERLAALEQEAESPAASPRREMKSLEARLRALEESVAGSDLDARVAALLDDPESAVAGRMKGESVADDTPSAAKSKGGQDAEAIAKKYAAYVEGVVARWAAEYGLSPAQVEELNEVASRSLTELTTAKMAGASDRELARMQVEGQSAIRRIVGDDVYRATERERTTREARGVVPKLSSAVGLTEEQHERIDRAVEERVERELPDVVRIRSESLGDEEFDTIRERLATSRSAGWHHIRDEILTDEQRRRIPGW